MPYVCTRNGHLLDDPRGDYCPEHGSRIITSCDGCGSPWGVIGAMSEDPFEEQGAQFCERCGFPGPWVSRGERIAWLKDRLLEQGLGNATALELRELLDELIPMKPEDNRAVAILKKLKQWVPGLWERAKPVVDTLVAEAVKRGLEQ